MRTLIVHSPADLYGASRALLRLCSDMRGNGWEIATVLPEDGALSRRLRELGVEVIIRPGIAKVERQSFSSVSRGIRFCRSLMSDVWANYRLMARWRPDVVHTNISIIPAVAIAAKLAGKPHIWHLRESYSEFPGLWGFYKHFMSAFSTRIVCCSQVVAEQFKGTRGESRTRVVYEGMDTKEFCSFSDRQVIEWRSRFSPDGGPVIGVVGRIRLVRKGQEVFLAAAQRIANTFPTARFICIGAAFPGNEGQVDQLRRMAESSGIGHRCDFVGEIEDVAAATAAFDVSVMPSVVPEPFGNVVMEAMCLGKPAVASANGGGREQIEDGVTGFLFPAGDADALAQVLSTLLADPARARAMGEAGKRRFDALFTGEKGREAICEIYRELGFSLSA